MSDAGRSYDVGRVGRTLALIAFVTAVFLLTGASVLSGVLLSIGVAVVGAVAIVTAISAFIIAAASAVTGGPPEASGVEGEARGDR